MANRKIKGLPEIGNVGTGSASGRPRPADAPRRTAGASGSRTGASSTRGASQRTAATTAGGQQAGFRAVAGGQGRGTVHATRIADLGREAPDREPTARRSHRGRHIAIAVAIVAVLAAIVAGSVILSNSSAFRIESMVVNGVKHLTADEMTELAAIPDGATLINIDTAAVERNLKRDAWIQSAAVRRVFPHTLQIDVTEREVTVVVEVPSSDASTTRLWAMSSDGMWLMPVPEQDSEAGKLVNQQIYEDIESVLHIVDVPFGQQPEIGTYCTDENVNNALRIVASLTTSLSGQVATVRATDAQSTTLILTNGVEIAFGAATDIREKERVCLELLDRYSDRIAYINVRSVDSPTWRSL